MKDTLWLKIVIFFAILFVIVTLWKRMQVSQEGFETKDNIDFGTRDKYILKRNQDIYDDFYAQVYREIISEPSRLEQEIKAIQQLTQPSKEYSVFLDVGAGTSQVMNELNNRGYTNVYGVEESEALVNHSPLSNQMVVGSVLDKQMFEQSTFTHIICLGNQVYETDKKVAFFKNCYYWLKPGGYLVVHLFEKLRPNTTQPIKEKKAKGIDYKLSVEPGKTNSSLILTEQMTNLNTGQLRIHEKTLFMKEIGDIINDALYSGFIIKGKTIYPSTMTTQKEYLYFFQR